ncbi:bifunctional 2-polyprenyl-6-hydroxyphenol methylase/3-demethylubiquinol 3-O-methyltransferase UbiG [Amycolatopsis sp. MtRt-6]|uniref:class I SAM-dependent methyltransferase n=1 Tax=Amycolatopsis sp. MtRt-6 TaxID=2792782 RepID=UPI001A90BF8B|nr:class I SAM-dependent methyltransferase [Amycolatopsis sp. MtRt-6]
MEVTADGSPVDVYLLLPPNASILELGSGAGRVTHPLLDLGHEVVAVDDSASMLAHVRAETVCARIGNLDLGRTFDAVLLGSPPTGAVHRSPPMWTAPAPVRRFGGFVGGRRYAGSGAGPQGGRGVLGWGRLSRRPAGGQATESRRRTDRGLRRLQTSPAAAWTSVSC